MPEPIDTLISDIREYTKSYVDLTKHLTTLATGSIVLMAGFLDKINTSTRHAKIAIPIAICLFLISIIFALACCLHMLDHLRLYSMLRGKDIFKDKEVTFDKFKQETNYASKYTKKTFKAAHVAFVLGLISVAVFVIRNSL